MNPNLPSSNQQKPFDVVENVANMAGTGAHVRWLGALGLLLLGLLAAYWIAMGDTMELIACGMASLTIIVVAGMRQRAWILIIVCWAFTARTALFPIPISMREYAVILAAGTYLIFRIVSGKQKRAAWDGLDVVLMLNVIFFGISFLVHPIGLRSLGSDVVGARVYFEVFLALVSYFVMWRMADSPKAVSRIPIYMVAGAVFSASLYILTWVMPSLPGALPIIYVLFNVDAYTGSFGPTGDSVRRLWQLGPVGESIGLMLCSYFDPLKLFNPLRAPFYGLLGAVGCVLAAGYRSGLTTFAALMAISARLHRGWRATLAIGTAVLLAGMTLALGNGRLYELPGAAQRALSFLPGHWDPMIMADAQGSVEGRLEWWRLVFRERLIQNWWLGDGFGSSMEDQMARDTAYTTGAVNVTGQYHSGPLTAIRYVGIIGMLLFYALMIASITYSMRCLRKCRGTILQPAAIFLAARLIWVPIVYTFIFGAYDVDFPSQILMLAVLRVVGYTADRLKQPDKPVASATPPPQRRRLPVPV